MSDASVGAAPDHAEGPPVRHGGAVPGDAVPAPRTARGAPRRRVAPTRRIARITASVALAWVILDQAVKAVATNVWASEPLDLGVIRLVDVRNEAAAFNLPGLFPGFFIVVTVVVAVLVVRAVPRTDHPGLGFAYGLVLGGAFGNALDRVFRAPGFPDGAVVDMFDLGWFPVFNVADSGITVGAALLVLLLSRVDREDRAAERARAVHRSVRPDPQAPHS